MRRVIGGGPRTGKTTAAGPGAYHTDDLINRGWDKAVKTVSKHFDKPGDWTVEGVQTVRGLRDWLKTHPTGKPCDELVWKSRPVVPRSEGQRTMAKGCETVLKEIEPELRRRGVSIKKER